MTNEEIKMLLNSRLEKIAFGDFDARAKAMRENYNKQVDNMRTEFNNRVADMKAKDKAATRAGLLTSLLGFTTVIGGGFLLTKLYSKRLKNQIEDKMKSLKEYKKDEPADSPANRDIGMYNKSLYDQKAILEAKLAEIPGWLQ